MTKKELIEGGWIDKYVLGLTSEVESSEIERLAALYPEVQDQINQARSRICGKFNRNLTQPALRSALLTKRRVLAGSAITVVLLLSGIVFLWNEHFLLRKDYNYQCEKLAQEQAKVNQMTSFSKQVNERSRFLNASSTKRIKLKGCEDTPDAEVMVFQCRHSGKMMLQVIELPALEEGQLYTVWAKRDNGDDELIGELKQPIRYDSLYVLDTVLLCSTLQINAFDPVHQASEPVCLATIK